MTQPTDLRTSQAWADYMSSIMPGFLVMDPDGWDRKNFDASWAEEITFAEFLNRTGRSTVVIPDFQAFMALATESARAEMPA